MILILKNIDIEGPGTIGTFFEDHGWDIETIELNKGNDSLSRNGGRDQLPEDLSRAEAIIILGGPMNVYEENKYPFLKEENELIKEAIRTGIPTLGICLGAQLIAKACGARVKRAKNKEIGWHKVKLTPEAAEDPMFKGVKSELDVFQWHGDTFDIPDNSELLATSKDCKNQVFRYGKNAYGLQFHVEISAHDIVNWVKAYKGDSEPATHLELGSMLKYYHNVRERFDESAKRIYMNFSRIIMASG
ncbi:MAG: type 1 glutamine amidotransferase [Candidatus Omnitrophica bacterium]|nr:type 1 glutamine amidotransferase [Candidatus Omnitrophota bacterium]